MSKYCVNCGEKLDDASVFCFKCKHNPDELWSPEQEKQAIQKEKNGRIISKVIIAVVAVAAIIGIVLIVKSCTGIHRNLKYHGATVKFTKVSQVGNEVILHFDVKKGYLDDKDIKYFHKYFKITVDDCTYSETTYQATATWSSSSLHDVEVSSFDLCFTAPPDYHVSEKNVHIPLRI